MSEPAGKPASAAPEEKQPQPDAKLTSVEQENQTQKEPVVYSMSPGLSHFLGSQRIALALSSYQSGKFYLLGQSVDGGLLVHERFFRKAMGLCVPDRDTLLVATLFQILTFRNVLEQGQQINHTYDACYVPRQIHVTGELDAHDIGLQNRLPRFNSGRGLHSLAEITLRILQD